MDINALRAALEAGDVTINFTKVNGHKRTMLASLHESVLPTLHPEKTHRTKDANLLIVFDTQMQGWRTIRVDSIADWTPGDQTSVAPVEVTPPTIGWAPATPAAPAPATPAAPVAPTTPTA